MPLAASGRFLSAALVLGATALLPGVAAAQADVSGQVVDRRSGRGVAGARVEVARHPHVVITGTDGRFTVRGVRGGGERSLIVSALGYESSTTPVAVGERGRTELAAPVALAPNPVMLEALRVSADRLETRRRAVPYTSRVHGVADLASSNAPNVLQYVRDRASVRPVPCRIRRHGECVVNRAASEAARVWVDDVPIPLSSLAGLNLPDVARVEVYQGGRAIVVYTNSFMERVARGDVMPRPIAITL